MRKIMIVAMASVGVVSAFGAIRAVTPDMYGGNPKAWQLKRHHEKMAVVTNGGSRVVFVGDSITHFWETAGRVQWNRYFSGVPYRALDLGISADRTEHILWRLGEGGELDGYEAKCILLMIGTNNTGHFPLEKETPIDTIEGIRSILALIAKKQPTARTILTAIFPRGSNSNDALRLRNDAVNRAICRFADGKKVIWCDFSDKFLAPDGTLSRELFPDLLHPNALGYEIWASAVIPLIDKVLSTPMDVAIPSVWPSNPALYAKGGSTATIPSTRFGGSNWWDGDGVLLDQRNRIVDNGAKEFDVVWVGDSITHRWYRKGGEGVQLWARLSERYNMLNLGIGGDRTENVLWRLRNGDLEGYKAKLFTVMIGTNNGSRDPKPVAEGVRLILEEIRAKHPESKIVLMPIFPRSAKPTDEKRVQNGRINDIIRGYADGKTVRWLDFNAKFLTADGTLTKDVMNDLLHPNEKGYQIWLDAIGPTLREVCGK